MAWQNSLLSYGGFTQGQALPYWPAFYNGYYVANNDYIFPQGDGVDNPINGFYFDLPYTAGNTLNDFVPVAKFAILNDQQEIVRYIGIRYKYESNFSFGRTFVYGDIELGYFDANNNWVHMGNSGIRISSVDGDITYRFGLTCHICSGTAGEGTQNEYDFFGAVICIHAQAKTDEAYAYTGILDARSYVQGKPRKTDEEVDPDFGPASEPEGYTGYSFDDHSDTIGLPSTPQSILSLGFVNVYKCDANSLTNFGDALFPDIQFPSSLSDVGEVLAAMADSIWNSKLIDYVISVHCVPGNVSAGQLEAIKVGTRTMQGIMARKITSEYVDFDFGTLHTDQLFRNFADYMCEASLYLPMYGFISLKPEEWNGGDLSVKYRFNVIDGSFTAYVFATSNKSNLNASLIGQYGGSCVVHLPVSNISYASMFSSLIGGAAAVGMGVASGGASMVAGSLAASNAIISAAGGGDAKKSNSYSASSSFMSRMKPYLIISAPVPSFSKRYAVENGLPSNVVYLIGDCVGFTKVDNPILDNIPCTTDEKERIRNYLRNGVVIK